MSTPEGSEDAQNKSHLEILEKVQTDLNNLGERLQIKATKNSSKDASSAFTKLKKAQSMLDERKVQSFLANPPELFYKKESTHMFEFETRIKNLERLLGPETQKPADVPEFHNFGGNLLRAYELMCLFTDPIHLDYTIQRLQLINTELESLSIFQESLVSEGQHVYFEEEVEINNQVDQLLELFERIESLIQQAPILISRLKTMGSFHNEALDMNVVLPKLTSLIRATQEDSKLSLECSQKVSDSFQKNEDLIAQSYQSLDTKILALSQRLNHLESQ